MKKNLRMRNNRRNHRSLKSLKRNLHRFFLNSWIETAIWEVLLLHLVLLTVATWKFDDYLFSIWGPYWVIFHHPYFSAMAVMSVGSLIALNRMWRYLHPIRG